MKYGADTLIQNTHEEIAKDIAEHQHEYGYALMSVFAKVRHGESIL